MNTFNCIMIIFSVGCHYHILWQFYVLLYLWFSNITEKKIMKLPIIT